MIDSKIPPPAWRDTKWVEGVRGMAAVFVMTSHLGLAYAGFLEAPRRANQPAWWYNAPFLRVPFEGAPWVSVFLILTGFVNALKPLRQARSGQADAALASLASSCFRRSLRLMLPCTIATIICWVMAESGAFVTGARVMSGWLVTTCPTPSGGVLAALYTLMMAVTDTWTWNHNGLERNQWAMLYFLKGSLAIYVFLLATVRTKAKYRMWLTAGLIAYGWQGHDPYILMPMFTGVFLAETSMTTFHTAIPSGRRFLRLLPFILLVIGWYLISFPNTHQKRMAWSDQMLKAGIFLFPTNSDIHAFYSHAGATCIITAIVFSSILQKFFNLKVFQWLGARSFPLYLVHGPVLRSFLNWILFPRGSLLVPLEEKDPETGKVVRVVEMHPMPSIGRFVWAIPLFLIVTLVLSDLWLKFVEPLCGRIAKKIEDRMLNRQPPQMQLHSEKLETMQEGYPFVESSHASPYIPFSRATTPMNEEELVLPR